MADYKPNKTLIGNHVIAVGCCGMGKDRTVFGILSYEKEYSAWIVTVIDEDGSEMPYSVYDYSIKEA